MILFYLLLTVLLVLGIRKVIRTSYLSNPSIRNKLGRTLSFAAILAAVGMAIRLGIGRLIPVVNLITILAPLLAPLLAKWSSTPSASAPPAAFMDEKEARNVLGVSAHATDEEIREAYKRLMQKNHPDSGGNDYLASKINQARDVLLKK